jgi:hypothetical protein
VYFDSTAKDESITDEKPGAELEIWTVLGSFPSVRMTPLPFF